jgi:hypothetical protein
MILKESEIWGNTPSSVDFGLINYNQNIILPSYGKKSNNYLPRFTLKKFENK